MRLDFLIYFDSAQHKQSPFVSSSARGTSVYRELHHGDKLLDTISHSSKSLEVTELNMVA